MEVFVFYYIMMKYKLIIIVSSVSLVFYCCKYETNYACLKLFLLNHTISSHTIKHIFILEVFMSQK